ncbi:DUF4232 domain-containing protein [Streptomyces chattanoogensis]|uniref:DUF4232 domain-containing protein n=1 Tax=Streptomyces chattanoogensis TaxID=66876 RepID=UPI0036C00989
MSHRITLRRGRKAAAATLIAAAAAVALTACEGGKADAGQSPAGSVRTDDRSPAKDSPEAPTSQDGSAKGRGTTDARNASSSGRNGANNGSGNSGSGSPRCTTDTLQAGWGADGGGRPDMHSDAQQTAAVWLKNTGSRTCTLGGFPGVQIKGNDGGTLDLPRSAKKPVTVQLKPGAHASFTMTLLPSVNGDDKKIEPGTVLITPPNEKKNFRLKWPYGGAILDQSGATHPGTYVNPIAVG